MLYVGDFKVEDFRYLDGLSNYGFTSDGRVYNHKTNRWIGNAAEGRYSLLTLRNDSGDVIQISKHRCIATLFVKGWSEENNIVNHINALPGDDRAVNLEWTTYRGNSQHAGLLGISGRAIEISVRNPNTNEILHFPTATLAGRYAGISKDNVLWRIEGGEDRVYPEGLQYRKRDDSKPWITDINTQYGRSVPVLLKDVETGNIMEFAKQSDLASYTNLCLATINISAQNGDQRLLDGRYMVKLITDPNPWREIRDVYKEHGLKKAVIVINEQTGEEKIYPSARACAIDMGLLVTTLNERLNKNGSKAYNGFRFKRY